MERRGRIAERSEVRRERARNDILYERKYEKRRAVQEVMMM